MRVISVTPAGRRRYVEILVQYLLRQRGHIHEHHWWVNTADADDIAYLRSTCAAHPDFFKLCEKPYDETRTAGQNIWKFWCDYADPETLYLRFDDDIVWMADDAVEKLIEARQAYPDAPLVLGNIVNNAVCSAAHQQAGLISTKLGIAGPECMDKVGWRDPRFARLAHLAFLADAEAGQAASWTRMPIPMSCGQRFSINVISWFGRTFATLPELPRTHLDEEAFVTLRLPVRLGQANVVCSEALFAHYAFYKQRGYIDWTSDDLLERYRALAEGRPPRREAMGNHWRADKTWRLARPFFKLGRSIRKRMGKPVE